MTKSQSDVASGVRPNIQITHTLNGRVKDYADANDLTLQEAYQQIIETGLKDLQDCGE